MDPFDLSLNPAISGSIFFNHNYSDEMDENDFFNFEKNNLEEKFTEDFNKVFNPITPDNKEDSFSEFDSSLNANNIDDFIFIFQKKLSIYYFNKDFDGIINKIEKKFPYFFNEKNHGLLYIIQKLRFFELLREENINEAKTFYQEKLLILLKEVKKQNWETKNKFFNKLIKKPSLVLKQGDLQKKYYDSFNYELDKSIRSFLAVDETNEIQSKNEFYSSNNINYSSSLDFDNLKININSKKYHKSKEIIIDKETNDDDKKEENNDEKNGELDIENWSTQEEFSDFEEEIQQKCSENLENKKSGEIDEKHINAAPFLTENENLGDINDPVCNNSPFMRDFSISSSFSKSQKNSDDIFNNFPQDQEDDNIENDFIIDTSSKNNHNIISGKNNYNNLDNNLNQNQNSDDYNREISTKTKSTKSKISKKSQKSSNKKGKNKNNQEIIFNQLPFLNSFKPKYIKRETIDKKIIRTFKNYVVKEYKEHRLELNNVTMDQDFFINFVNGNLLPPIDFYDATTGEYIKFNSFNCSYLLWFFSKKGVKEIYGNFINEKGKEFIDNLSDYYEISSEEKNQLHSYIFNFPFIFDISLVNNITNGMKVTHIYRTVDKNKIQNDRRKKKEYERNLDLKRIKSDSIDGGRERSRSRDFDDDEK
jgi:hypothetical protein